VALIGSKHFREHRFETVQILFVRFNDEWLHLIAMLDKLETHAPCQSGLFTFFGKNDGQLKVVLRVGMTDNDPIRSGSVTSSKTYSFL
jgi:hypothetical protein